ncbi:MULTISPECIES: hypothetical protein [Chryseobacterium]|uniref:Uncharacterized protein n=1 Tax=Chryseobacterium oleae TaxID=491207 RepID=A0A1I4WI59_CHROL|nr:MULTISPECIES: hypothetical protein [Chryseobacterium]SFN12953.1 hypothetical protein SAMN05421594_1214 [Chryseobacterium oleae]SHE70286.1 hypothetical protein SAMN02787100_0651 [Chryseobacterium sp. OV279]
MKKLIVPLICLLAAVLNLLLLKFSFITWFVLAPIVLFFIFHTLIINAMHSLAIRICYGLAFMILLIFPLLLPIIFYFNIGGIAEDGQSALAFVFLPIYACMLGVLPCLVALILKKRNRKKNLQAGML